MKDGDRLVVWWAFKNHIHLGDAWAAANTGIYLAKKNNLKSVKLAVAMITGRPNRPRRWPKPDNIKLVRYVVSLLDYSDLEVEVVKMESGERHDGITINSENKRLGLPLSGHGGHYDAIYCSTKVKRVPPEEIQKKICYCFAARFFKKKKLLPPNLDKLLEGVQQRYPDHELIELKLPLGITEDIEHLSNCRFYFGVDTGPSHICRSVKGVPLILIKPIIAHPSHACERKLIELKNVKGELTNLDELLEQITEYEERINSLYPHLKVLQAADVNIECLI